MLVFLALNGVELQHSQEELSDIVLQVAAGEIETKELLNWILLHQIQIIRPVFLPLQMPLPSPAATAFSRQR